MTLHNGAPARPASGNPAIGTVDIVLDRPRRLKLTHAAMELLEEHTGVNMLNPVGGLLSLFSVFNLKRTTSLLWALLTDEDPALTRDGLLRIASTKQIIESAPLAIQAVRLAFPEIPDAEATEHPPQAEAPSGSTPGSSAGPLPSTTSASPPISSGG